MADIHWLVFNMKDAFHGERVSSAGTIHIQENIRPLQDQSVPYRILGFAQWPVTGWSLHSFRVGEEEQLMASTGVPLEVIGGLFDGFAVPVPNGRPVRLTVSHDMPGLHSAQVCMGVELLSQQFPLPGLGGQ